MAYIKGTGNETGSAPQKTVQEILKETETVLETTIETKAATDDRDMDTVKAKADSNSEFAKVQVSGLPKEILDIMEKQGLAITKDIPESMREIERAQQAEINSRVQVENAGKNVQIAGETIGESYNSLAELVKQAGEATADLNTAIAEDEKAALALMQNEITNSNIDIAENQRTIDREQINLQVNQAAIDGFVPVLDEKTHRPKVTKDENGVPTIVTREMNLGEKVVHFLRGGDTAARGGIKNINSRMADAQNKKNLAITSRQGQFSTATAIAAFKSDDEIGAKRKFDLLTSQLESDKVSLEGKNVKYKQFMDEFGIAKEMHSYILNDVNFQQMNLSNQFSYLNQMRQAAQFQLQRENAANTKQNNEYLAREYLRVMQDVNGGNRPDFTIEQARTFFSWYDKLPSVEAKTLAYNQNPNLQRMYGNLTQTNLDQPNADLIELTSNAFLGADGDTSSKLLRGMADAFQTAVTDSITKGIEDSPNYANLVQTGEASKAIKAALESAGLSEDMTTEEFFTVISNDPESSKAYKEYINKHYGDAVSRAYLLPDYVGQSGSTVTEEADFTVEESKVINEFIPNFEKMQWQTKEALEDAFVRGIENLAAGHIDEKDYDALETAIFKTASTLENNARARTGFKGPKSFLIPLKNLQVRQSAKYGFLRLFAHDGNIKDISLDLSDGETIKDLFTKIRISRRNIAASSSAANSIVAP